MSIKPLTVFLLSLLLLVSFGCDDIGDEGVKKVGPLGSDSLANGPGPADDDAPTEFTTTETGLRYRVLRQGDGEKPRTVDGVTVHYRGWLDDGTIFDESYDKGKTATFTLAGVIPGWSEGLQYVAKGGMIELEIPPHIGYGEAGSGRIGPNATLHFIVELFDIDVAPEASSGTPPPKRSSEMDAMLEGFVLSDLAGNKKNDDADSTPSAEEKVDGESPAASEEESEGDAGVE